jgi:hypothetical protein
MTDALEQRMVGVELPQPLDQCIVLGIADGRRAELVVGVVVRCDLFSQRGDVGVGWSWHFRIHRPFSLRILLTLRVPRCVNMAAQAADDVIASGGLCC